MALTTLASVKNALSPAIAPSDTSQDALLTQMIAGASSAIRNHCNDYFYGTLSAISIANPAVCTCPGHELETGNSIQIVGSNSTPTIDGLQTVTVIDENTFTVPVTTTGQGARGVFAVSRTEFYSGNGSTALVLRHRPVQSITNVWEDQTGYFGTLGTGFASTTLLVAGTDYALKKDNASNSDVSKSGKLLRINGLWRRPPVFTQGLLTIAAGDAMGNYKVQYLAGYLRVLSDMVLAANQMVAMCLQSAGAGVPMLSEKYDEYEFTMLDPDLQNMALNSVKHLLSGNKRWQI
jgi:hypothetical protein